MIKIENLKLGDIFTTNEHIAYKIVHICRSKERPYVGLRTLSEQDRDEYYERTREEINDAETMIGLKHYTQYE